MEHGEVKVGDEWSDSVKWSGLRSVPERTQGPSACVSQDGPKCKGRNHSCSGPASAARCVAVIPNGN